MGVTTVLFLIICKWIAGYITEWVSYIYFLGATGISLFISGYCLNHAVAEAWFDESWSTMLLRLIVGGILGLIKFGLDIFYHRKYYTESDEQQVEHDIQKKIVEQRAKLRAQLEADGYDDA